MSYRSSYTSWKSSLAPNYKSPVSNAYSSRDDVSSTARYTSLASPSSYRPSFSGGTYRLKRDTPIVPASTYSSRYSTSSSVVPKAESSISDCSGLKACQLKRYGSSSSNLGKYSREPSPAALEHTNRIKSRDPSPATRSLRGKSRDPSPVLDTKCKIGYGSSTNSYRLNVPKSTSSPAYGTRYGSSTTARTPNNTTSPASISYLSASDFKARSISKTREAAIRKSNENELQEPADKDEFSKDAVHTAETSETEEEGEEDDEEEKFVSVSVCTRATSPTPPGAATTTTVHRTRRVEIAKTIEKTVQRSTRKKKTLEKEIQSDRLDDSTRYSRFGLSSRVSSSYSPHTDRYSATSLRYSHSPLSITSKSSSISVNSESKREDCSASSSATSNKSNKSPLTTKLKLSPPKSIKINSRQSSLENLSAQKPPAAPKADSPTKSLSSSASLSSKLPNKDFRKSALNVGPTDRPRKSRTPSTGTDSDLNTVEALNGALQAIQRLERSPSAGSEVSNASSRSIRRTGTESKLRPKCHNKILGNGPALSPKNSLSRNNSTTNIKPKLSTSSTQSSSESTTGSAANMSTSSGTENCTESKKPSKKMIKKKSLQDVTTITTNSTSTSTISTANSAADIHNIKSSIENSISQQQAAAVSVNRSKKSDSSISRTTTKTPSDKDPLRRLKKLSSVSNFFAAQQQQQQENTNSDEQIHLESSENSSSGNNLNRSLSQKSVSLTQANETKTTPSPAVKTKNYSSSSKSETNSIDETKESKSTSSSKSKPKSKLKSKTTINTKSSSTSSSYCPQDTTTVNASYRMPNELQTESLSSYATTNLTTSSTSGTDQDESSWWQDTSRQIDTASALDFNLKDEMRFKVRHNDSGETAWWLCNDEDNTLAEDDLKTLNQEEELEDEEVEEHEEATDQRKSLTSSTSGNAAKLNDNTDWWINETNDVHQNEDEVDHETNYGKNRCFSDLENTTNGYCAEEAPTEAKPFPKSRLTPETGWWIDENETENDLAANKSPSPATDKSSKNISQLSDKLPKQNGSIQLKICRVESGEKAWWLQGETQETSANENNLTVEATIALPKKNQDKPDSSSSNCDTKSWWMSGPTKKLFNIQKVESGEKAWWQEESSETKSNSYPKPCRRNNSQEQEWWLNEEEQQQSQAPQQLPPHNGHYQTEQQFVSNTEDEAEAQQYPQSPYSDNILVDSNAELSNSFSFEYSKRPPPLGQCASPVQQETLPRTSEQHQQQQQQHQRQQCKSPYDNIPMTKVQTPSHQPILETPSNFTPGPHYQQDVFRNQSAAQQQQAQYFPHQRQQQSSLQPPLPNNQYNNNDLRARNGELFISRHQNIDELLGGSCRPISPLFYDNGRFQAMPLQQRNMFVEEITPDQVRIHDSTAQMPVIQRIESDCWPRDSLTTKPTTPPRFKQRMIDLFDNREEANLISVIIYTYLL